MNGPGHYAEGERLLAEAKRTPAEALYPDSIPTTALLVALAQAHFTAALAAATAMAAPTAQYPGTEAMPRRDRAAWLEAAGTPAPKPGAALSTYELDEQNGATR